jgi:hypothetical protein
MNYVDGYVLPVPKKHLPYYFRIAKKAGKIWESMASVPGMCRRGPYGKVGRHISRTMRIAGETVCSPDRFQVADPSRPRQRCRERPAPGRHDG